MIRTQIARDTGIEQNVIIPRRFTSQNSAKGKEHLGNAVPRAAHVLERTDFAVFVGRDQHIQFRVSPVRKAGVQKRYRIFETAQLRKDFTVDNCAMAGLGRCPCQTGGKDRFRTFEITDTRQCERLVVHDKPGDAFFLGKGVEFNHGRGHIPRTQMRPAFDQTIHPWTNARRPAFTCNQCCVVFRSRQIRSDHDMSDLRILAFRLHLAGQRKGLFNFAQRQIGSGGIFHQFDVVGIACKGCGVISRRLAIVVVNGCRSAREVCARRTIGHQGTRQRRA